MGFDVKTIVFDGKIEKILNFNLLIINAKKKIFKKS